VTRANSVAIGIPPGRTIEEGPRFAQALAVKSGVLLWSELFLMESFGITPEEALDIRTMAFDEIAQHKATTKRLGWN